MLMTPPRCWRNRSDCSPLHSIESLPDDSDEFMDALESGEVNPDSYVCAGCVREADRAVPRDAYRLCWVNDAVDEMGEYDEQDLAHQAAVITQALAIIAARRFHGQMIEVLINPEEGSRSRPASDGEGDSRPNPDLSTVQGVGGGDDRP